MKESPAGGRGGGRRLPARLFWRVYLNGLLLLALVALSVFAVGAALGRSGMPQIYKMNLDGTDVTRLTTGKVKR